MNINPCNFFKNNTNYFVNKNPSRYNILLNSPIKDTVSFKSNSKDITTLSKRHNSTVKILFSDIDGTIAQNGKVPQTAKEALAKLKENNIPIVIATGRVYESAKSKIEDMGLSLSENDYVITQQGAVITNGLGEILYEKDLNKEDVFKIIKTLENYTEETGDNSVDIALYINGISYSKTGEILNKNIAAPIKINSFKELMEKEGLPAKIILHKRNSKSFSDMEQLKNYFETNLKEDNLNFMLTRQDFFEITCKEASKGNAMKTVSNLAGTKLKNAAAIGDAENDIQMLQIVGREGGASIAMGNSENHIKNFAKFVTGRVDNDGYSQAIDEILKNNERLNENI